ncbi:hypothetical protein FPOAC2_08638 [Fusarium poae]|uniref:hypothetical protein n=1 Tax=Fusarium poae TaxID=36050 RepID=UPI001CE7944E|nr:hypothetical protein FPOAC1_008706 [Fusarium poae]KAG8669315.1 hypothetical protein FPOAC1_008706 [Fusarium poae]
MNGFEVPSSVEYHLVEELCTTSTLASFYNLLHGGEHSDITIVCGDHEFKAHRAIVCTRSLWFEVAFTAPAKKRIIRKVEVKGVNPEVFQRFLEFIYTGTYTIEGETPQRDLTTSRTEEIESMLGGNSEQPHSMLSSEVAASDTSSKRPVRRSSRKSHSTTDSMDEAPDSDPPMATASPDSSIPEEILFKTPLPPAMTISLELYNLAHEYKVPALQLLARERFFRAAKARWLSSWEGASWEDTKEFEDVVLSLYTSQHGEPMWKVLVLLVQAKTQDDMMKRRMHDVAKEHYDLLTGVEGQVA